MTGGPCIVWWRAVAALVVAARHPGRHQLRQRLQRRQAGHRRPGQRVGPPRLVGWGLATPDAVQRRCDRLVRRRRGGRAGARDRGQLVAAAGRRRVVRGGLALHRRARSRTATRDSASCSCSCSSAWSRRSARRTCRPSSITGAVGRRRRCRSGCSRPRCSSSTTCATSRATRVAGKRTLAVRLGDQRTPAALRRAAGRRRSVACRSSRARRPSPRARSRSPRSCSPSSR